LETTDRYHQSEHAVAVSVVDWPAQRFVSGEAIVTDVAALSVSTIESTEVHPVILSVTVTLYLVVPATTGVIVGLATVELLQVGIVGDQL
jgi:hypothetical protein